MLIVVQQCSSGESSSGEYALRMRTKSCDRPSEERGERCAESAHASYLDLRCVMVICME